MRKIRKDEGMKVREGFSLAPSASCDDYPCLVECLNILQESKARSPMKCTTERGCTSYFRYLQGPG